MSPDFIYTMKDLRKVVPPKREILKGIWLSFFYGAKIGVLGLNGAGKSSLLRIMAGQDPDFIGEAMLGKGYTVGMLDQEPKLDPAKSVLENIQDGVGGKMAVLRRWNEISARFAEPMDDDEMTKLLENIFRSVNIALVNELKLVYGAMGIDVWEVINAAKTKPSVMRFAIF